MTAATLWQAVKESYNDKALIGLTNISRRPNQSSVDDTVGLNTAGAVIALFERYAQIPYNFEDAAHVEAASQGVIALLYRRGGTTAEIEQIKWDQVFGRDGVVERIKMTGPRAHTKPKQSGLTRRSREDINGRPRLQWSDKKALTPRSHLPRDVPADWND